MAVRSYDQTIDTMVTTALDTMSRDPANLLSDSGEKFLKAAASKGRLFVVNDAENVRHPVLYDHGESTTYYSPDSTGSTDHTATGNLTAGATEILTQTLYTMQAATRNINFPQSQPSGNMIDYVSNVVKANMMKILNEEECLFVRGENTGSGTEARIVPFSGDTGYTGNQPMSVAALLHTGSNTGSQVFGNLASDNINSGDGNTKWATQQVSAGSFTGGVGIFDDVQTMILQSGFSEVERPTDFYCSQTFYEFFLAQMRKKGALPDPVQANLGRESAIPFGGITIDWSRYLEMDEIWDRTGAAATHPLFGINWNSLRLNLVRAGGISGDSLGFIRTIGGTQPHPLTTNIFKRIEWKRQWSLDRGRDRKSTRLNSSHW